MDGLTELVRQHHERYDGKGYPNQRKKEEIILGDFQDQLVIMLETEHNLGIQVFISRDQLAQSDSIHTIYDKLLKLSSQISNNILMFLM